MIRTYLTSLLRFSSILVLCLIAIVSVVIWFFGETVTIGGLTPLASPASRIITICGLFLAFFLITLLRHVLARHTNARLINSMLADDELVSLGSDGSSDEVELIRQRFEKAMTTLRDSPVEGRKSRNFLFELPWYVLIGPSGTGKTTILRNAGLDFPEAEFGQEAIQGIGGTRNCDWWISNDAVMIDTAGRYTTQDVNSGLDAAAWSGFLNLLRKHRGRRPVNGVLLVINMADVALASEEERTRQAETLRQRLRELHRAFSMRLPVYLVLTKCDLVAGFEEFFDSASEEDRNQVWGITFPFDEKQMTYGQLFESGYIDLLSRLERRSESSLAGERNSDRRCRIHSFPYEMGSLASVLRVFINDVFRLSRYEAQPLLRGVYFTSGTQKGEPFDRLLGAMSQSFDLSPSRQSTKHSEGKAYFVRRLLTEIVFREQNIVGRNRKMERRLAAMHLAGYAAVVAAVAGFSAFWIYGLNSSVSLVTETNAATDRLETRLNMAEQDRSLANILPALNSAGEVYSKVALPPGFNPTTVFGIDVRSTAAPAAKNTYATVLETYLHPAVLNQLETKIRLLSDSSDVDSGLLRDQLSTYLMLKTGENFSRETVRQEFEDQSEAIFAMDPANRQKMDTHMGVLLSQVPITSPVDVFLVQAARSRINEVPPAHDVYRRMVIDAARRFRLPPVSLVRVLGTGPLRAGAATPGASNIVPGFYTKQGFYNFFLPRLPEYIRDSTGSDWVLGDSALDDETYSALAREIVELYTSDYIDAWRTAISQVRVIEFNSLRQAQQVLQELSAPQSAMTRLLKTLRQNTLLPLPGEKDSNDAAGLASKARIPGGKLLASASQTLDRTVLAAALGDSPWPGLIIEDAFQPLTSLVDPQNRQGTLDRVQQLFGDLYGSISSVTTSPDPAGAAFEFASQRAKAPVRDSFVGLRASAATKPEPLRSMIQFVYVRNWQLMVKLAHEFINAKWQQEVVPICNVVLFDRYPFVPQSDVDVSLRDFSDLFGPSGIIDSFFTDYLSAFVHVRGQQFAEMEIENARLGISPSSLSQFAGARAIRRAFFGADGTAPQVRFTIEPQFLDPRASRATFKLDDKEIVYRHGPLRARDFVWPGKLDASVAHLSLTLVDGTSKTMESFGSWAIFRMLEEAGNSQSQGIDEFEFSITVDDASAIYRLKADRANNPFAPGLYSSFRCPPSL
jgi:type VI secretion system protein ImpL